MKKIKLLLITVLLSFSYTAFAEQFNVLLFTKTDGWHHQSIRAGVNAMEKMAEKHFFSLEWDENAEKVINEKYLEKFDVVVFLNTTGDVLNDEQQKIFEKFYKSGKGFVGIHSASDTEYDWEWYTKLVGHMFVIHPAKQTAMIDVVDSNFPGMNRMPKRFLWTDEWYEFGKAKVSGLKYLLTVDEKTYAPEADWGRVAGDGMGDFHPISWYHNFDGGRSFYTNFGHIEAGWKDELFMTHLYGGLYWAATGKGLK